MKTRSREQLAPVVHPQNALALIPVPVALLRWLRIVMMMMSGGKLEVIGKNPPSPGPVVLVMKKIQKLHPNAVHPGIVLPTRMNPPHLRSMWIIIP
jgi:hypothetical protein